LEIIGQIAGKYQIIERIGQDGTSAIYKATNLTDDSTVALKVLSSTQASDTTFKARISREIEALQALEHPRILPILDYGELGELAYIVMPFYQHGTLQDRIDEGLTPEHGARIISQVSEALEYSHAQGITHRNLKPSNILIDENGNAVLSDFGFEHKSGSSLSPTAEARIGTPAYMSPEQCRGEELDSRSDQYSLAVVIYQMTTGRLPFDAAYPMALVIKHLNDPVPSPRDINPKVPKKVEAILLKGLSKDPGRRFASVAALNQALQDAIAHQKSKPSESTTRRTRQSSTEPARTPRFMKGARVALVLSLMLAVPGAVYGLVTFGAGFGAASGNSRALYSSQDPTEFTAAGYAVQSEIAPPEATLISPDVVPTEVEATQTEITDSQAGEGEDVTPTATGMMEETPSATPSETPTATPTETPRAPPSPTPTVTKTPRPQRAFFDTHCNTYRNGDCNSYRNGHCNSYRNGDCNAYRNGDCNAYRNGDCNVYRNGHVHAGIALDARGRTQEKEIQNRTGKMAS